MPDDLVRLGGRFYEPLDDQFPIGTRYKVARWPAVAVVVVGRLMEPCEDTVWSGFFNRTEWVGVVMVGDDTVHLVEADDLVPLARREYCGVCGQVGCAHDARDLDDDDDDADDEEVRA